MKGLNGVKHWSGIVSLSHFESKLLECQGAGSQPHGDGVRSKLCYAGLWNRAQHFGDSRFSYSCSTWVKGESMPSTAIKIWEVHATCD